MEEAMSSKKQRLTLLKKRWGKKSPQEIAVELGVSLRTVQRYAKELDLPAYDDSVDTGELLKLIKEKSKTQKSQKHVRNLSERVIELEAEVDAMQALKEHPTHYKICPCEGDVKSEAVAVMVASDWHIEEMVYEWQVSGLNEFNAQICKERIGRFFRHGVKLLHKEQSRTHIDTLVLALLGDFISGGIHDELLEGNRLLPIDAIIEAQEHIASGIQYLLANTDVKLVIPCSSGNHGRMTQKIRISTEAGNSLERMMYHSLAQQFAGEPRVQFVISNGYHTYVKVFNFVMRFHHGHSVRYHGGVGGITIPLNKAVDAWNKGRYADLDVIGHFHTFLDGGRWLANGSIVGYGAYSLSIKASPESPRQAFFLVDRDFGKTVVAPIIVTHDR